MKEFTRQLIQETHGRRRVLQAILGVPSPHQLMEAIWWRRATAALTFQPIQGTVGHSSISRADPRHRQPTEAN